MKTLLLLLATILAAPAVASETPWQEVAPGVRMRMIAEDARRPDGTTMVGLEIDMPRTTKTYWRVPGETGIPTELDLSRSRGIAGQRLLWPYPTVDRAAGYLDYVYYGPTVLPIALQVGGEGSPVLEASVTLGICSDVCMPASATFSLPLDLGKADPAQQIRLQQAAALAPLPWQGAPDPIGRVGLDAAGGLTVEIAGSDIDPASLIADVDGVAALFGAPQKSPEAGLLTLPLLGGGSIADLEGKSVHLTFLAPAGAYETSRVIGAAAE